jgi:inner membrane protein
MDSVTQIALGSAVGVAVMGRRAPVWKAALWGAVAGTTPDLDVVVDFGDGILNMTRHRAESHAIVYLTLLTPIFAGLANWFGPDRSLFKRWLLAFWLVFMTHIFVDYLTVYGTQLLQPLSDHPFRRGSIFIIDPLYTVPLLLGLLACLASKSPQRWRWNTLGLSLSSLYLVWGLGVQQHVENVARASLPNGVSTQAPLLATPSPLNSILWRVVVLEPDQYHEGWYSLLDSEPVVNWTSHDRRNDLVQANGDHPGIKRLSQFTHGFYKMHEKDGTIYMTDLRMGFEPNYFFTFNLGPLDSVGKLDPNVITTKEGSRPDISRSLPWLVARIQGKTTQPPPQ